MNNSYETLGSGGMPRNIPNQGEDGGSRINETPDIGKDVKKVLLKGLTVGLAMGSLGSAAACGPIDAAVPTSEPTITATATQPVEVHVGDATVLTANETNSEVETVEATPSPSPTEASNTNFR